MKNRGIFALAALLLLTAGAPPAAVAETLTVWTEKTVLGDIPPTYDFVDIVEGVGGKALAISQGYNNLYRSADGGVSWTRDTAFTTWAFTCIRTDFAGKWMGQAYISGTPATVTSEDDGETWTAKNYTVYAGDYGYLGSSGRWFTWVGTQPKYTTDFGATWSNAATYPAGFGNNGRRRCAGSQTAGVGVFVGYNPSYTNNYAYTTNYGVSWTAKAVGLSTNVLQNVYTRPGWNFFIPYITAAGTYSFWNASSSNPSSGLNRSINGITLTNYQNLIDMCFSDSEAYALFDSQLGIDTKIAHTSDVSNWTFTPTFTSKRRKLVYYAGTPNQTWGATILSDRTQISYLGNYNGPEPPEPPAPEGPTYTRSLNCARSGLSGPNTNELQVTRSRRTR